MYRFLEWRLKNSPSEEQSVMWDSASIITLWIRQLMRAVQKHWPYDRVWPTSVSEVKELSQDETSS